MKKTILMSVFALASLTIVSCDKKTNSESSAEKEHVHSEGEAPHEAEPSGDAHSGHDHSEGEAVKETDTTANQGHKEGDGHDHSNE